VNTVKIKIIRQKIIQENGLSVLMAIVVKMFPHYKEGEKDSIIERILLILRKVLKEVNDKTSFVRTKTIF